MKKRLVLLLLTAALATFSSQAQVNVFEGPLKDLLKQAKQNNKDALVMVSASWCGPCKMFMKKIAPMPEMGDYINNKFVFGHYDIDKEDPNQIDKTYGVSAYPTFLILDSKGKEIGRAVGARADVAEMKALIESAYETPVTKLRKEFAKDPAGKADEYINALREEYRSSEIQTALDKLCGIMDPAEVISKYVRDIKFNSTEEFNRPLALAISNSETLFAKYGSMLERPITNMANGVMSHLGENNKDELSSLRSAIASYDKYSSKFAKFVSENGEDIIKGDVPALLKQIKKTNKYGPQPRLTALFAIMRKTKADGTIGIYKDQMRSVLKSIDSEEKSDKNFMKNLWKYVE